MDLTALRSWVRDITLAATSEISDAQLDTFINAGLHELAALDDWPFLQASTTVNFTASTGAYALPTDFGTLIEVVIGSDGEKLKETTRREAQKEYLGVDEGTPAKFYLWGEQINFVPVPSASPAFSSVIVDYYKSPTDLVQTTDEPPFYEAFHPILAEYAISRTWEYYEDFDRSGLYYARFRNRAFEMSLYYNNRAKDDPLIIGGESVPDGHDPQRPFMTWLQPFAS